MINESNSFVLRARFKKYTGAFYTFTGAVDALLNSISGIGKVTVSVYVNDGSATPTYAVTNDGVSNITLHDIYCFLQDANGSYVYYPVRGGLPDGEYWAMFQYQHLNSGGQYEPRLSTTQVLFTVENQIVSFV